jgi:hypothetical protein
MQPQEFDANTPILVIPNMEDFATPQAEKWGDTRLGGVAASVPSVSDGEHRTRAIPLVQSGDLLQSE